MKILRIFVVFAFLVVATPAYAQFTITTGTLDYSFVVDGTTSGTSWNFAGPGFLSFVSAVPAIPAVGRTARGGSMIAPFDLEYVASGPVMGNISLGSSGFINYYYANVNNPNTTRMTLSIPEHTIPKLKLRDNASRVFDLPFTMHGTISIFTHYDIFSNPPHYTTAVQGSGKVFLVYYRKPNQSQAHKALPNTQLWLGTAHFTFAAPARK